MEVKQWHGGRNKDIELGLCRLFVVILIPKRSVERMSNAQVTESYAMKNGVYGRIEESVLL